MQTKTLRYITVQAPNTTVILTNEQIELLTRYVDAVIFNLDGDHRFLSPIDLQRNVLRVKIYGGRMELGHHAIHDTKHAIDLMELDQLLHWSPPLDCRLEELTDKLKNLGDTDTETHSNTNTDVSEPG